MSTVFAIRNIRASRVNLLMNDFAAGLPSPLSFLGLGDFLLRQMGLEPWKARTIPVLHKVYVSDGRTKPEMEPKGGAFMPIETMEDLVGTVDVSLLMDLPGCYSESRLKRMLTGRRIAGGLIQNDDFIVEAVTPDGSAFRSLRRGYAMLRPDQPERQVITTGSKDGLSAIAELLFPETRELGHGWIVPSAVGYRLLEDPETAPQRIRTRSKDVPHVFAEPVLGIAELVSIRNSRLTGLGGPGLDHLFWSWDARADLILGHSDYHPTLDTEYPYTEVLTHD